MVDVKTRKTRGNFYGYVEVSTEETANQPRMRLYTVQTKIARLNAEDARQDAQLLAEEIDRPSATTAQHTVDVRKRTTAQEWAKILCQKLAEETAETERRSADADYMTEHQREIHDLIKKFTRANVYVGNWSPSLYSIGKLRNGSRVDVEIARDWLIENGLHLWRVIASLDDLTVVFSADPPIAPPVFEVW